MRKNNGKYKEYIRIFVMAAIIVAITGFPYIKEGLCAYFPDLMYHMLRTEGVKEALLEGNFPARIYMNFYNGYGYGSPLFYPDIFLIIPAMLRIANIQPLHVWKVFALLLTAISTLTTYFSIKYISKDSETSIAATFMIMLSQFYLADLHLRAGISEYMAFIFIPVLIAGIYDFFVYEGKKTYLMGIAFVGLLLSHSIMTFIGILITIVIFVRMIFVKKKNGYLFDRQRMLRLVITAMCTVLLTSYYWLPMLEQMSVLDLGYSQPWAHIGKYTQPFSSFFSLVGHFSTIAYTGIGIPILPLALLCVFLKKPENRWSSAFLMTGIFLYLITTKIIPWNILENTPLNMIQFTYRFWPYAQFFVVLGITLILSKHLNGLGMRYKRVVLLGIIGCAILAGAFQNRMTAWVTSEDTRKITDEYLLENSNYVGAGEWLPLNISENVTNLKATQYVTSSRGESQQFVKEYDSFSFYTRENAESYTIPLIYYKGYSAWIESDDGIKEEMQIVESEDGLLQVINQTGASAKVYVKYTGTILQKVSMAVTVVTMTILITFYVLRKLTKKNKG